MKRIAVDIGGTFTDCFMAWDDQYLQAKALTTHNNLALGFNAALDEICKRQDMTRTEVLSQVDSVRYATTLGTNALIERKGPKVGLLITRGFEGTIPTSRARGYGEGKTMAEQLDLTRAKRPLPLVPPQLIRGVRERIDYKGEEIIPIDEADLQVQIRDLMDTGIEALVISTANGTMNPAHETRIREIFREEFPSSMLGSIPVVLASEISGRRGEYVRTTSAIIDAYLHATMFHAMTGLERNLRESGYRRPMLLIHNTGGMAHLNSTDALQTVHSGPVAGVAASEALSQHTALGNVVATDMGGTSFDIGIVVKGGIKHYDFLPVIDRWLVTVPMVHLASLGAGGGSIVSYDPVYKTIRVGPESAGSEPGPACYNRGGKALTVTDVDLLLGYLDPEDYANGSIQLSRRRAERACRDLCQVVGVDEVELAKRVKRRVDHDMAVGITSELNARGYNPEEFNILAYGGNGPLHACGIADAAHVKRVLIPPFSPVFSACGAGGMQPMHIHEFTRTTAIYNQLMGTMLTDFDDFNDIVEMLEERGRNDLLRQGVAADQIRHRLELDIRYGSQRVDTGVVLDQSRLHSVDDVLALIKKHREDYEARFGDAAPAPETGIWISTYRVATYVDAPGLDFGNISVPDGDEQATVEVAQITHRKCHFYGHSEALETPIYGVAALQPGVVIDGPAIVNPGTTTYVVEPGWRLIGGEQQAAWLVKAAQSC